MHQKYSLTFFCTKSFHGTHLIRESVIRLLCITAKFPTHKGRSDGTTVTISVRYLQTVLPPQMFVWDCKMKRAPQGWLLEAKLVLKHATAKV